MIEAVNLISTAESISKILAILGAGAWAFWRYVYQGEFKKRIEFNVEVNFVANVEDVWLVELVALVNNKGLVTHSITEFTFHLRAINPEDPITEVGERANYQTNMPHQLKKGSWLPAKWGNTFIRPGICNRYTYVTTVPNHAVAVLLTAHFNYSDKNAFHTAAKLSRVPVPRPVASANQTGDSAPAVSSDQPGGGQTATIAKAFL